MDIHLFHRIELCKEADASRRATRLKIYYSTVGFLCNAIISPYVGRNKYDLLPETLLSVPFFQLCYSTKDMSIIGLAVGFIFSDNICGTYQYLMLAVQKICQHARCMGSRNTECMQLYQTFSDGVQCGVRQRRNMLIASCRAQGRVSVPWLQSEYWPCHKTDWYQGEDIEQIMINTTGHNHRISQEMCDRCMQFLYSSGTL